LLSKWHRVVEPDVCLRVLVAEDEPISRLRMARTIQLLGHEVLVANDGSQAWDLFEKYGVDVVVTDWQMPGLDGPELCRRVRADTSTPYTYVIFSTSLQGHDNVRNALAAGADDYLVKPTNKEDIEARLMVAQRVTLLHRERAQALADRETLLQVAREFALEADSERILSLALAYALPLLKADGALLYRWDETDEVLSLVQTTLWRGERKLVVPLGRGAAGLAAARRRPVTGAVRANDDGSISALVDAGLYTALAVPLLHDGRLLGALEVASRDARRVFSVGEGETLELLGANVSSALVALEHVQALQALADTDPLTGLANRRRATDVLKRYLNLARRRGHHVSLMLVDLDHFKHINDTYGHPAGDAVLQGVGDLLIQTFRGEDVIARWGGDEFVVGMYDIPHATAMDRLVQTQAGLRSTAFRSSDGRQFTVTFSAGLSEYPADADDLVELYGSADAALYDAKDAGRDRIRKAESRLLPT
jgi:diguanylate cyclase (GGDEF)-like protein